MNLPVCAFESHVWPRKKMLFYVAWGNHGNFQRYRLRFCPTHAADVHEYLSQFEVGPSVLANGTVDSRYAQCLSCRKPAGEVDWQVYITGYPTQDERKDYWGLLHVGCQMPEMLLDSYGVP